MQSLSSSPAHLLLSPSDNSRLLSGASFNNVGLSSVKDSSAFKKIQYFSKTNNQIFTSNVSHFANRYNKISNMYLNTSKFNDAYSYGTFRQHNYTSLNSNLSSFESLLDNKGVTKFVNFTLNSNSKIIKNSLNNIFSKVNTQLNKNVFNSLNNFSLSNLKNLSNVSNLSINNSFFNLMSFYPTITSIFSNITDSKTHSNSVKYGLLNKSIQKSFNKPKNHFKNINFFASSFYPSEILTFTSNFKTVNYINNNNVTFKFKDLKSSNLQFLSSERNIRIPDQIKLSKNNFNFNTLNNNFELLLSSVIKKNVNSNITNLYSLSNSN
jgi:hypothetical protein